MKSINLVLSTLILSALVHLCCCYPTPPKESWKIKAKNLLSRKSRRDSSSQQPQIEEDVSHSPSPPWRGTSGYGPGAHPYPIYNYEKFRKEMLDSFHANDLTKLEEATRNKINEQDYDSHLDRFLNEIGEGDNELAEKKAKFLENRAKYIESLPYEDFRYAMDNYRRIGKPIQEWVESTYKSLPDDQKHKYYNFLDRYWADESAENSGYKDDYLYTLNEMQRHQQ
jgi:hypothetical protein